MTITGSRAMISMRKFSGTRRRRTKASTLFVRMAGNGQTQGAGPANPAAKKAKNKKRNQKRKLKKKTAKKTTITVTTTAPGTATAGAIPKKKPMQNQALAQRVRKLEQRVPSLPVQDKFNFQVELGTINGITTDEVTLAAQVWCNPLLNKPKNQGDKPTPLSIKAAQWTNWRISNMSVSLLPLCGASAVAGTVLVTSVVPDAGNPSDYSLTTLMCRKHKLATPGKPCHWKVPHTYFAGPKGGWYFTKTDKDQTQTLGPLVEVHCYGRTKSTFQAKDWDGPLFRLIVNVTYQFSAYDPIPGGSTLTAEVGEQVDVKLRADQDGNAIMEIGKDSGLLLAAADINWKDVIWKAGDAGMAVLGNVPVWGDLFKLGWWFVKIIAGRKLRDFLRDNPEFSGANGVQYATIYTSFDNADDDQRAFVPNGGQDWVGTMDLHIRQITPNSFPTVSGGESTKLIPLDYPGLRHYRPSDGAAVTWAHAVYGESGYANATLKITPTGNGDVYDYHDTFIYCNALAHETANGDRIPSYGVATVHPDNATAHSAPFTETRFALGDIRELWRTCKDAHRNGSSMPWWITAFVEVHRAGVTVISGQALVLNGGMVRYQVNSTGNSFGGANPCFWVCWRPTVAGSKRYLRLDTVWAGQVGEILQGRGHFFTPRAWPGHTSGNTVVDGTKGRSHKTAEASERRVVKCVWCRERVKHSEDVCRISREIEEEDDCPTPEQSEESSEEEDQPDAPTSAETVE